MVMLMLNKRSFHITENYRGSVHRDCNINVKLDHKISVDFQLIMQELDKFNLK